MFSDQEILVNTPNSINYKWKIINDDYIEISPKEGVNYKEFDKILMFALFKVEKNNSFMKLTNEDKLQIIFKKQI